MSDAVRQAFIPDHAASQRPLQNLLRNVATAYCHLSFTVIGTVAAFLHGVLLFAGKEHGGARSLFPRGLVRGVCL